MNTIKCKIVFSPDNADSKKEFEYFFTTVKPFLDRWVIDPVYCDSLKEARGKLKNWAMHYFNDAEVQEYEKEEVLWHLKHDMLKIGDKTAYISYNW